MRAVGLFALVGALTASVEAQGIPVASRGEQVPRPPTFQPPRLDKTSRSQDRIGASGALAATPLAPEGSLKGDIVARAQLRKPIPPPTAEEEAEEFYRELRKTQGTPRRFGLGPGSLEAPPGPKEDESALRPEGKPAPEAKPAKAPQGQENILGQGPDPLGDKAKDALDGKGKKKPASPAKGSKAVAPSSPQAGTAPGSHKHASSRVPLGTVLGAASILKTVTGFSNSIAANIEKADGNKTFFDNLETVMDNTFRENTAAYDEFQSAWDICKKGQGREPWQIYHRYYECDYALGVFMIKNLPVTGEIISNFNKGKEEHQAFLENNPNASADLVMAHIVETSVSVVVGTVWDLARNNLPGVIELEDNGKKAYTRFQNEIAAGKIPNVNEIMEEMLANTFTDLATNYLPLFKRAAKGYVGGALVALLKETNDKKVAFYEALGTINLDKEIHGLNTATQKVLTIQEAADESEEQLVADDNLFGRVDEAEAAARREILANRKGGPPPSLPPGEIHADVALHAMVEAGQGVTKARDAGAASPELKQAYDDVLNQAANIEKSANEKVKALKEGKAAA